MHNDNFDLSHGSRGKEIFIFAVCQQFALFPCPSTPLLKAPALETWDQPTMQKAVAYLGWGHGEDVPRNSGQVKEKNAVFPTGKVGSNPL